MYYEVKRLLDQGERVVVTGLKGTGKSSLVARLSPEYDTFRSVWYVSQIVEGSLDRYKLFDRCNYIDRYAFQYTSPDVLEACIANFKEDFQGTYLLLTFHDKWSEKRDKEGRFKDPLKHRRVIERYLEIGVALYRQKVIKGLLVSYHNGWMSTEFATVEKLEKIIQERYLNG